MTHQFASSAIGPVLLVLVASCAAAAAAAAAVQDDPARQVTQAYAATSLEAVSLNALVKTSCSAAAKNIKV